MLQNFSSKVHEFVRKIPPGRLMSYGQVAAACGHPRGARQVGWALHLLDNTNTDVPWWRVVNNQGRLSIKGNFELTAQLQKELLISEGIEVKDDLTLDIEKYRWQLNSKNQKTNSK